MRSRSLNFAIAIVLRSFDQMAIADRDLDREKKIADHSCLAYGFTAKANLTNMMSKLSMDKSGRARFELQQSKHFVDS